MTSFLSFVALCLTSIASAAAPPSDQGIAFIRVNAIELNNRLEPNGLKWSLLKFRIKNMETGKVYAGLSPERPPTRFEVPPGTYCMYSVFPYVNQELVFCMPPYFPVKAGKLNNIGSWKIGIDFATGTVKLMSSFEDPDEVLRLAVERYPKDFN